MCGVIAMKIEKSVERITITITQDEAEKLQQMATTVANSNFECSVQGEFSDSVCDWENFVLVLSSEQS